MSKEVDDLLEQMLSSSSEIFFSFHKLYSVICLKLGAQH